MLRRLWHFVSTNGLHHPAPEWRKRKIVLANRLVFTAIFVVTAVFLFALINPQFPATGVAVGFVMQTSIFLLIRFGQFKIARWLLVVAPVVLVTTIAVLLNPPNYPIPPGRLLMMGMCLLPLVIFDVREWRQMLLATLFPVTANFAFEPLNEWLRIGQGNSVVYDPVMRYLFLTCAFVLLLACVAYLVRITYAAERKNEVLFAEVQEKNEELKQTLEVINEQNEELKTSLEIIHEQNQNIQDSINYAWRIQSAIMPDLVTLAPFPVRGAVFYQPRDVVSGDFYWFTPIPGGLVAAGVDCTGHGVPGAFMSVLGRTLLQQAVHAEGLRSPVAILDAVDRGVRETLGQDRDDPTALDGMELALAVLDFNARTVRFAGANRPLLVQQPGGTTELLRGAKRPIGGKNYFGGEFEEHSVAWQPGTRLFFFSDGITDQMGGPKGRKWGTKAFVSSIEASASLGIEQQTNALGRQMAEWQGKHVQQDDMLMLALELA